MRIRFFWAPIVVTLLCLSSCGDDGGGGPPGGSGGSGGDDDAGEDEPPPPEPGTCRRLCCASSDCDSGESCGAFDASYGTLGTCSGGGWGTDGGAVDPDGGTGTTLPPGCWTLNAAQCHPLTNEGCAAGDACDVGGLGDPEFEPNVSCYGGDSTQGPGEACDNVEGPFCIPGFHCVPN